MPTPAETVLDLSPSAEDKPHYEAVGRFITAYASAEAAVHVLARNLSGMSDDKARILFKGLRLTDLTDRIRGMMRLDKTPADITTTIDDCLTQLDLISERRNNLVHRSTTFLDGKLFVTDLLTAKTRSNFESDIYDKNEMDDMQWDCTIIYLKLVRIANPGIDLGLDILTPVLTRPWRYKSARPTTRKKRLRSTR